jgi:hypothetical protein
MADYYTPTVVQPTIPYADMTPLEQLLLAQIFESESNDNGLYFFAEIMPIDQFELPIETLRGALAASDGVASEAATFVIDSLKDAGGDYADIELDLSVLSWEFIFQDIVKRSTTLDHVTVVSAFTCSRMRPDGFGGMAAVITADAIMGKSTGDILADFLDQVEHGAAAAAPGVGSHVLLSLSEEQVHAEIGHIIETDETLTTIAADTVTDADIHAGCLLAVERTDLREERGAAIHRAALAAICEAERRQAVPA